MSAARADIKLHLAGFKKIDPDDFDRQTLKDLNMPQQVVMRHRTPQLALRFQVMVILRDTMLSYSGMC